MISNKDVGCDELITFWRKPHYPVSYHFYNQSSRSFKIFGNKIIISRWDKKLFQSGAGVISKWGRGSYFKVGQLLI